MLRRVSVVMGVVLALWSVLSLLEMLQEDYSVMTQPAPSPTAVATEEPSGNTVATARPSLVAPSATPSPELSNPVAPTPTSRAGKLPTPDEYPVGISIPAASVSETLEAGGLNSAGDINPPRSTVMWLDDVSYGNVAPGQLGTGIIAGHVVKGGKKDVFYRLDLVKPGDEVFLDYPGGTRLEYEVISAEVVRKDDLKHDARLWTPQSSERRVVIITCSDDEGFRFNATRVANYVVIAVPK